MSGIQVFNASGVLTFNADDRLARILGTTRIEGANGVIYNGNITAEGGYYIFSPDTGPMYMSSPDFTIQDGAISWVYQNRPSLGPVNGTLIYGMR